MDNSSDSFRGELDSVTSTDSLQLISDEFHLSTPDVSNIELSKRAALLELENERLRVDLENARIDLNARIASNQGLKGKITELFVEVQQMQQEKQKLQNTLTDTTNHLSAAESSAKWYQSQVHILMASKKSLQVEIETYQNILKQRQRAIAGINASYKQLNTDYTELTQQYQREKREMQSVIKDLQSRIQNITSAQNETLGNRTDSPTNVSIVLEATEDELRNTRAELKTLEQRLVNNEVSKMWMENTLSKQRILISSMEENIQKCQTEKNETTDILRKTQFEIQQLRSKEEILQTSLLDSKQEQSQVEDAISHLRIQLSRMIYQYKLLKLKNAETEEKLNTMQDFVSENKRLKTLSHKANSALLKKLREEKFKVKNLQQKLCSKQINCQSSNTSNSTDCSQECFKDFLRKGRLKSINRIADESIDEGYGDSSINISSVSLDIPSSSFPINSVLLNNATSVLVRSKNFYSPMEAHLNELRLTLQNLKLQK